MKECAKCKQVLSETEFHRKRTAKDGLQHLCKTCVREYYKKYREKNKDTLTQYQKEWYEKNKEMQQIYHNEWYEENKEGIQIYHKKWYEKNKEREQNNCKEYYQKNKKELLQKQKEYSNRLEVKKHIKEYDEKRYRNNKTKILLKHKDYYQEHKKEHREINRKRELRKNGLFEDFTSKQWLEKVEKTKGICLICNHPYEKKYGLTMDHTPPISKAPKGYHYTIDDVTPMCKSCNSSKGDKIVEIKR